MLALLLLACRSGGEQRASAAAPAAITAMDPPASNGSLAPFLRATPRGLIVTWLETPATGPRRLRFARWQQGTWSEAVTIVEGTNLVTNWADVPAVSEGRNGALVASWLEAAGEGYAYHAIVARSVDGGATWTRLGPLHDDRSATEHGFVSLTPDGDAVRAVWLDGRATADGGATALRSALVTDTVTGEEVVDDRVCDCCSTSAAVGSTGVLVAYRDRSGDELRDVAVGIRGPMAWASRDRLRADGWKIVGCPVNGPAIDARGERAVVAWYTYAEGQHRVKAAFSSNGGATFGEPVIVDEQRGARAPLGRVAVSLDAGGDALVAWIASRREEGTLLVRRVSPGGSHGSEVTLASVRAGRDAGFPEIAIAGDELVAMWTEPGSMSRVRAARVRLADVPRGIGPTPEAGPSTATAVARVGAAMPALEATGLDGTRVVVPRRGQPTLINVWATWCEPCRQELFELGALHARFGDRGLAITAISVDGEKETAEVAVFVEHRRLPFTVVHDRDDRASAALAIGPLPVTLLVDRDGSIRWRSDGAIRADDPALLAAIELALRVR